MRAFCVELRMCEESEYTEAVVEGYEDDILVCPLLSVELRL